LQKERDIIARQMEQVNFWDNQIEAQKMVSTLQKLVHKIEPINKLETLCDDLLALKELGEELGVEEIQQEFSSGLVIFLEGLEQYDLQLMLSGEHDNNNAFLTVQSGAGGVDATDFTEMLVRMYQRWAEANDFDFEEIEFSSSDEGGVRHATFLVRGAFAYGKLTSERGVHRLVRISPYDSQGRRHTSFAAVEVMPELNDTGGIEIDMNEVRVDTYRAGGAGGQHVNKTDSAVRMTHLPTGIVVQCQNQRSQLKNKETAKSMLASKLFELKERAKNEELQTMYGNKGEIAWGSQIRSYVLHPYQMIKDHRTQEEVGNAQSVLDGNLTSFIEAYLRQKK
jgi:peptide chain release factor 2